MVLQSEQDALRVYRQAVMRARRRFQVLRLGCAVLGALGLFQVVSLADQVGDLHAVLIGLLLVALVLDLAGYSKDRLDSLEDW